MIPVVGFCTINTPYEEEAEKMKASAYAVGIKEVRLYKMVSKATWELNCQQKAAIILQACEDLKRPFLYVDADARFNRSLPDEISSWEKQYDIGVHYFKKVELLSGTLYINPTPRTKFILLDWVSYCMTAPTAWDQKILQGIFEKDTLTRINYLPPEYTWIYDLSLRYYGGGNPIITHYQASRKYKRLIRENK